MSTGKKQAFSSLTELFQLRIDPGPLLMVPFGPFIDRIK